MQEFEATRDSLRKGHLDESQSTSNFIFQQILEMDPEPALSGLETMIRMVHMALPITDESVLTSTNIGDDTELFVEH